MGGRGLDSRSRLLWFALLAWLAFRSLLLLAEVATQPLYPWDAWTQWATKARVWFELKAWVPFVNTDAWLAAKGALYTDAAPTYPATVPLWQVWSSLALGRYDDAWMNLPWWFAAVAFGIAIYGALRRIEFGPLAALVGTWIVVSLPLADVHVALAGYADLPMAAYFTLAALATLAWTRSRSRLDAALALIFALACPFIKTPGVVWAVTLVPAVVVALLPRHGVRVVAAGFALGIAALMVLAQTSPVILNYQLHLDFAPAWGALLESFFMLGNWNLLWYGVIAATLLAGSRLSSVPLAPFTMIMVAGVLFPVDRVRIYECAGLGRDTDDDQSRGVAPCAARRRVDAGRVPGMGDAEGCNGLRGRGYLIRRMGRRGVSRIRGPSSRATPTGARSRARPNRSPRPSRSRPRSPAHRPSRSGRRASLPRNRWSPTGSCSSSLGDVFPANEQ